MTVCAALIDIRAKSKSAINPDIALLYMLLHLEIDNH